MMIRFFLILVVFVSGSTSVLGGEFVLDRVSAHSYHESLKIDFPDMPTHYVTFSGSMDSDDLIFIESWIETCERYSGTVKQMSKAEIKQSNPTNELEALRFLDVKGHAFFIGIYGPKHDDAFYRKLCEIGLVKTISTKEVSPPPKPNWWTRNGNTTIGCLVALCFFFVVLGFTKRFAP